MQNAAAIPDALEPATTCLRMIADVHPFVVAVLGPTASGKSALGRARAEPVAGELINSDTTAV